MIPTYCFVWCGARSKIFILNILISCALWCQLCYTCIFFFFFFLSVHSYNHFSILRWGFYIIYKGLGDVFCGAEEISQNINDPGEIKTSKRCLLPSFTTISPCCRLLLFIFYLPPAFQLYSVLELFKEFSLLTPSLQHLK